MDHVRDPHRGAVRVPKVVLVDRFPAALRSIAMALPKLAECSFLIGLPFASKSTTVTLSLVQALSYADGLLKVVTKATSTEPPRTYYVPAAHVAWMSE
jgi:hypothetical protein